MIANELLKNIRKKFLVIIAKEYFVNQNLLGLTEPQRDFYNFLLNTQIHILFNKRFPVLLTM